MGNTTTEKSALRIDRRARRLIAEFEGGESDDIFTTRAIADQTGTSEIFWSIGRLPSRGYGPSFDKIGSVVGYRRSDILAWLEKRAKMFDGFHTAASSPPVKIIDRPRVHGPTATRRIIDAEKTRVALPKGRPSKKKVSMK